MIGLGSMAGSRCRARGEHPAEECQTAIKGYEVRLLNGYIKRTFTRYTLRSLVSPNIAPQPQRKTHPSKPSSRAPHTSSKPSSSTLFPRPRPLHSDLGIFQYSSAGATKSYASGSSARYIVVGNEESSGSGERDGEGERKVGEGRGTGVEAGLGEAGSSCDGWGPYVVGSSPRRVARTRTICRRRWISARARGVASGKSSMGWTSLGGGQRVRRECRRTYVGSAPSQMQGSRRTRQLAQDSFLSH